ncbi:30S ribosomal protein S20 [Clostridia bacterium]|nr:30S ribosomal protein S20 [Clostridia bacterium]
MPNIKSAKKRVKVIATKTLKNQMFKTALKTIIKKFELSAAGTDKTVAQKTYIDAVKKIDQAAAKGIVHKNKAARKKSQFAKKLASIG